MNELGVFFSSLGLVVCCMKWINANQHDSWFSIFSAMFNSSCCILFYLIFFLSSLHFLIVFICLVRQPVLSWGSLSLCSTQASGHHLSFFLNHSASIQSLLFVILAYNSTAFNTQCAFADAAAFSFTSSDSAPIVVGFALHFDDH